MFNGKTPTLEKLRGHKKLKINGMTFVIKRINPLVDFPANKMPQIFTEMNMTRRPLNPNPSQLEVKRQIQDMMTTIEAGVVEPELGPVGSKGKLTAEDLFRDPGMGLKLFHEILDHSLNNFRGLKRVFFSIGIRLSLLMHYLADTPNCLLKYVTKKELFQSMSDNASTISSSGSA